MDKKTPVVNLLLTGAYTNPRNSVLSLMLVCSINNRLMRHWTKIILFLVKALFS